MSAGRSSHRLNGLQAVNIFPPSDCREGRSIKATPPLFFPYANHFFKPNADSSDEFFRRGNENLNDFA